MLALTRCGAAGVCVAAARRGAGSGASGGNRAAGESLELRVGLSSGESCACHGCKCRFGPKGAANVPREYRRGVLYGDIQWEIVGVYAERISEFAGAMKFDGKNSSLIFQLV